MREIHKLLVIRLSALGDVCMTLPVLDSLCRAYPSVEVTLLTTKVAGIVANTVIRQPNFKVRLFNKNDYKGILGLNRLYDELRQLRFDAVADLHDVLRSKWVRTRFRLAGVPVKVIDKGRSDKKALVAHKLTQQLQGGVERYRDVFVQLGLSFQVDYDGRHLAADLAANASNVLPCSVGIAPFAQHQGKIYPIPQMRRVIDLLLGSRPDLHIYLFGGKDEADELEQWRKASPDRIVNLAGKQGIDTDLCVMSRLQAMISMDSANMHLASLVGLRCFSIWGATHRYAGFLGYSQQEADCLEVSLPCRPCSIYGNKPCQHGDFRCMTGIQPETIAQRVLSAL